MVWRLDDPQGDEASKVKYEVVPYTRGKGIDVGCGPHKAFPHFIGIDSLKDTELFGIAMQPDLVCEDATQLAIPDGDCDFVFSSHLLEHIQDYRAALAEWWRVIKPGGHLCLYLPHRDLYPNVGQPGANPDHKHDFVPKDITDAMRELTKHDIYVERDEVRSQGAEYSFLLVMRKGHETIMPKLLGMPAPHGAPGARTACVVRYGGFGDMIQASNILPELKRQGYHVTVMTTPKGQDILKHDPHVDGWFIQDNDQVPNQELNEFWKVWAPKFDKFINLCESVEGTLLAMPGRANHGWPTSVRRSRLNVNYLEFTSQLAELPYTSEAAFYPSPSEDAWARSYCDEVRAQRARDDGIAPMAPTPPVFFVMWALAGSSMHKAYPWADNVIAALLDQLPEVHIIFTGDEVCQVLEAGWEDNPRVRCTSGILSIRQSLALAQSMDCVVGPETGILNAVAFEDVDKVVMLSHSTHENLTKHWVNTTVVVPKNTPCYPCHRLHYDREFCPRHESTAASVCATNTQPQDVFEGIVRAYKRWSSMP